MSREELILNEIRRITDNFFNTLKVKPRMLGSIEEIESCFFWIDQIWIALNRGHGIYDDELSWRSFLNFKGIRGSSGNTLKVGNGENDPFDALRQLRKEYEHWVGIKLEHQLNSNEDPLLQLMRSADNNAIIELLSWFAKHPSKRAIEFYADYINNDYYNNPNVAIGLSRMGDNEVIAWAIDQIRNNSFNLRKIALGCIASSPLDMASSWVESVIDQGDVDDINIMICSFCNSASSHLFKWIEQILTLSNRTATLNASIEMVLIGSLIHKNKDKAIELLRRMGSSLIPLT